MRLSLAFLAGVQKAVEIEEPDDLVLFADDTGVIILILCRRAQNAHILPENETAHYRNPSSTSNILTKVLTNMSFSSPATVIPLQSSRKFVYA